MKTASISVGELLAGGGETREFPGEVADHATDRLLGRDDDGLRVERRDQLVDEPGAHPRCAWLNDAQQRDACRRRASLRGSGSAPAALGPRGAQRGAKDPLDARARPGAACRAAGSRPSAVVREVVVVAARGHAALRAVRRWRRASARVPDGSGRCRRSRSCRAGRSSPRRDRARRRGASRAPARTRPGSRRRRATATASVPIDPG